ncbi:histidine phosphatase family protein [Aquibacillus kalidii]|uniref:histidine phosphatase family protein n=1 Tax=Aquibacillus kalidii TaxID=2762597 RepID=UPI001648B187|nr:histidine phosphatase family protein [Aquibacillus kalidii]
MEISLIRHGRSKHKTGKAILLSELVNWNENYDESGILMEDSYPKKTLETVKHSRLVLTSDLKRAKESARILIHNPEKSIISLSLFREAELPKITTKLFTIALSPKIWALVLRILWIFGVSNKCESYKEAKKRADEACDVLQRHAKIYTSVTLVGHGFFNSLIARKLRKKGWLGKKRPDSRHWGCSTYCYYDK